MRHHVISLNLVEDSLLLIKDLEESRHDEHEGDAGACPSHLKYKLFDDVVHEKALVDELPMEGIRVDEWFQETDLVSVWHLVRGGSFLTDAQECVDIGWLIIY